MQGSFGQPPDIGRRFRKVGCFRLEFEVIDSVWIQGLPHARLVRVDLPSEDRLIALDELVSGKTYAPVDVARDTPQKPGMAAPAGKTALRARR